MSAPKARSPKPLPTPVQPWQPPLPLLIIAIGLPALAGLLLGWTKTVPGTQVLIGVIGMGLSVIAAAFLLILGIICVIRRTLLLPVVIGGVVLVGLLVLAWSPLPLQARFAMHGGAFSRVAAETQPSNDGEWQGPCPSRIGSYPISRCAAIGTGFLFYEPEGGFLHSAGFAYLPDGPKQAQREGIDDPTASGNQPIVYHHLSGDWYTFSDPW